MLDYSMYNQDFFPFKLVTNTHIKFSFIVGHPVYQSRHYIISSVNARIKIKNVAPTHLTYYTTAPMFIILNKKSNVHTMLDYVKQTTIDFLHCFFLVCLFSTSSGLAQQPLKCIHVRGLQLFFGQKQNLFNDFVLVSHKTKFVTVELCLPGTRILLQVSKICSSNTQAEFLH